MKALRWVWRAIRFEAGLWRSLFLLATGRRDGVRDGTTPIEYHRSTKPVWIMLLVVNVVELPVLHMIVPWPVVKGALLVLGIWSVLLVGGLWASFLVRPYLIDAAEVRLRHGPFRDLTVPWSQVASVRAQTTRDWPGAGPGAAVTVDGDKVGYLVVGETSAVLALTEAMTVPAGRGRTATVWEIHIGADEPAQLTAALLAHAPAAAQPPVPTGPPSPRP